MVRWKIMDKTIIISRALLTSHHAHILSPLLQSSWSNAFHLLEKIFIRNLSGADDVSSLLLFHERSIKKNSAKQLVWQVIIRPEKNIAGRFSIKNTQVK